MLEIILITAALTANTANALSYCPNGCNCDDNTLMVTCGEGHLDVLPIALNPSIQRLVIKTNKIKTIDSSIHFYSQLTFLDLSNNHILNIPQKTFAHQRKLQELHLNDNKIGSVNEQAFTGLIALTVLNLRGNIIDELPAGIFSSLENLEELNLGQNRINKIDTNSFRGLVNLKVLYLNDNILTTIPTTSFPAIGRLAELFLGINSFGTVPSNAFQDLKALSRLDLRGAGLRNISHESFKGLESLRILDISDNQLKSIPTVELSLLTRLEELSIGQNDYELVPQRAFLGMVNLRRLEIVGANRLKRIQNDAFASNTNLESLTVSSNKALKEIQVEALKGLPYLKQLSFSNNALETLEEGLIPWNEMHSLDLSENPITCDCRVMWLRNLLVTKNLTRGAFFTNVVCSAPERLRDESLRDLQAHFLGCSHAEAKNQAMIGALLVASAATATALALILYRCRRKIQEAVKGGWSKINLGCKEREYQKTFSDEDFISRQPPSCKTTMPHNLNSFTNFLHPNRESISIEFKLDGSPSPPQQHHNGVNSYFQAIPVPLYGSPDFLMKLQNRSNQNHYCQPIQNLHSAKTVDRQSRTVQKLEDAYSYAQSYALGAGSDNLNFIHSNSHYALPISEHPPPRIPSPTPPALPQRNGSENSSIRNNCRRSTTPKRYH